MRALPLARRCHEGFDAMRGDDRARSCDTCGVRVHDLSARTETEARAALASDDVVCVRFAVERSGNIRFRAAVAGAVAITLAASGVAMASGSDEKPSAPSAGDAGPDTRADVEHWMGRK
jgi:hypothetical protein